jgi:hypothetical protein
LLCFVLRPLTGAANPHLFPCLQPLFVGLDEAAVPARARSALCQAKADFEEARHNRDPRYATCVGCESDTDAKVYQGQGYRLKIVHEVTPHLRCTGPEIILDSSITGGRPYSYSEVK